MVGLGRSSGFRFVKVEFGQRRIEVVDVAQKIRKVKARDVDELPFGELQYGLGNGKVNCFAVAENLLRAPVRHEAEGRLFGVASESCDFWRNLLGRKKIESLVATADFGACCTRSHDAKPSVRQPFAKAAQKFRSKHFLNSILKDVSKDHRKEEIERKASVAALPNEGNDRRKKHGYGGSCAVERVREKRFAVSAADVKVEEAFDVLFHGAPAVEDAFSVGARARNRARVAAFAIELFLEPEAVDDVCAASFESFVKT